MSEMEEKLGAILGNPQLMQQIMSMAATLGQKETAPPAKQEPPLQPSSSIPDLDPVMIGKIMALAGNTNIDRNQKTLLRALEPYLAKERLQKLEKAMRAAKLAGIASTLLQSGTIPFLSGR